MRSRTLVMLPVICAALVALSSEGRAQSRSVQGLPLPVLRDSTVVEDPQIFRRRVENLIRSGRRSDAIALLEEKREKGALDTALARRLARLYRDSGQPAKLEAFLMERGGEGLSRASLGDLKMLAEARFALDRDDEARAALDQLVARDPSDPSLLRLAASVLGQHHHEREAVDLLVAGRERLGSEREFAQQLGRLYAVLGQPVEATREFCQVIVAAPLNVSLMRGQILELVQRHPDRVGAMLEIARKTAAAHPQIPQLSLVIAELRLRNGDATGAWDQLRPLLLEPDLVSELLRMAMAGLADSRLPGADPVQTLRSLRLSARIARGLLANDELPQSLQPRVYDTLTRTLMAMLENARFAQLDQGEQVEILGEARGAILEMQRRFHGNRATAAAMLRLAAIYVDALQRPADAIQLYQSLLLDPNAPKEQIQLARVGLGRSYIATGDTAKARRLFFEMGQDMGFVEGQGRAQYHLGMLDFMGAHFDTAEDRFKAVAMESPRAEYTNDALDLALILAEEEMSDEPNLEGMAEYGRALYYRETFQPDSLASVLRRIDGGRPGVLRDRARLDLAKLWRNEGQARRAIPLLSRIAKDSPKSRYAPVALELEADILDEVGEGAEALSVYESVLVGYENYVFLDQLREKIRALRNAGRAQAEGELP